MRALLALALSVAAVGVYSGPALGQVAIPCDTPEGMAAHLARGWGETKQAEMIDSGRRLLELYANRESGTWTLVLTLPGQPTCMLSSGQGFETVKPVWGEPT